MDVKSSAHAEQQTSLKTHPPLLFVHHGVISSPSVWISLLQGEGRGTGWAWFFLRSAGTAARQKQSSERCWQAKLLPLHQPCQHNHLSTALLSYNSRPFVVDCSKALVRCPLLLSQVLPFICSLSQTHSESLGTDTDGCGINFNKEVGTLRFLTAEQWKALCFFVLGNLSVVEAGCWYCRNTLRIRISDCILITFIKEGGEACEWSDKITYHQCV